MSRWMGLNLCHKRKGLFFLSSFQSFGSPYPTALVKRVFEEEMLLTSRAYEHGVVGVVWWRSWEFRRWSLPGGSLSLEVGFEGL